MDLGDLRSARRTRLNHSSEKSGSAVATTSLTSSDEDDDDDNDDDDDEGKDETVGEALDDDNKGRSFEGAINGRRSHSSCRPRSRLGKSSAAHACWHTQCSTRVKSSAHW